MLKTMLTLITHFEPNEKLTIDKQCIADKKFDIVISSF
jgi:hypothetical protein